MGISRQKRAQAEADAHHPGPVRMLFAFGALGGIGAQDRREYVAHPWSR